MDIGIIIMDENELKITCLLAVSQSGCIGHQGKIPWNISADMKHFRSSTLDKHLVMGRKTFESIPVTLARRVVYVLSVDADYSPARGGIRVGSIDEAVGLAKRAGKQELVVCGGAGVYNEMFDKSATLLVTHVDHKGDGDTFVRLPPGLNNPLEWDAATLSEGIENDTPFKIVAYTKRC